MKVATIFHLLLGLFITFSLVFCPGLPLHPAQAQDDYPEPSEKYSREELAQMLAPIALYPDTLLTQVLMASTYPIEVIEADRWRKNNPELKDEGLDEALLAQDWDPSVKAVCHFPSILALMSERITETTNIGNAFLVQESEVMDMIQELRAKARQQGNLTTNAEQKVVVEKETIIIEPANPRVIYVPYYDPFSIYGPWWYPAYPPYYWGPPGLGIGVGISFWPGFNFGFSFGNWSYFDWYHHTIYIHVHKRPRYVRHDRWMVKPGPWQHAPRHRRGVAYRDKNTARKYGQQPRRLREFRPDTRGFPEASGPERVRIERDKQRDVRARSERDLQERQRIESEQQSREQAAPERQERQRAEQEQRTRQRVDRSRAVQRERAPDQSRDNVFNRVDNGSRERQSSERGRVSRQKGLGSWDDDDAGGREGRGRGDRGRDDRNRYTR